MDCPSEERIIRMKLDGIGAIKSLDFNIPSRELTVLHSGSAEDVWELLRPLNFGVTIKSSATVDDTAFTASTPGSAQQERKLLLSLMAVNGGMFFIELAAGLFAESMGLISDSLDMLADAGVYGISLYAVGKSMALKKNLLSLMAVFSSFWDLESSLRPCGGYSKEVNLSQPTWCSYPCLPWPLTPTAWRSWLNIRTVKSTCKRAIFARPQM
jgi:hypothetical protein